MPRSREAVGATFHVVCRHLTRRPRELWKVFPVREARSSPRPGVRSQDLISPGVRQYVTGRAGPHESCLRFGRRPTAQLRFRKTHMAVTKGEGSDDRADLAVCADGAADAPFRYYLTPHIGGSMPGTTSTTVARASESGAPVYILAARPREGETVHGALRRQGGRGMGRGLPVRTGREGCAGGQMCKAAHGRLARVSPGRNPSRAPQRFSPHSLIRPRTLWPPRKRRGASAKAWMARVVPDDVEGGEAVTAEVSRPGLLPRQLAPAARDLLPGEAAAGPRGPAAWCTVRRPCARRRHLEHAPIALMPPVACAMGPMPVLRGISLDLASCVAPAVAASPLGAVALEGPWGLPSLPGRAASSPWVRLRPGQHELRAQRLPGLSPPAGLPCDASSHGACPRPRPFLQMKAATFRDGLLQGATVSTNGEFVELTRQSAWGDDRQSRGGAPRPWPPRRASTGHHHRHTGMFPCIAGASTRSTSMPAGRQSRRWSSQLAPSPSSMHGDATMPAFPGSQHGLATVPKVARVPLAWEVRRALKRGQEQA